MEYADAKMDKGEWDYGQEDEQQRLRDQKMIELSSRSIRRLKSRESKPNSPRARIMPKIKSLKIKSLERSSVLGTAKDDSSNKYVALYEAATKNDADHFIEVLERVLNEKADLSLNTIFNSVNEESRDTLLHVAVSHGNAEIVRLIGERFPFLFTKKNSRGDTVWHISAKTGDESVFWVLFYLRIDFKDYLSYSNIKLIKKDVTWEDLSLRVTNEEGNTALHESLINRHKFIADALIKEDVEVSYHPNKQNMSALYLAADAGFLALLAFMMENAARNNVNIKERLKGQKPLVHAAIMGKQRDVLKFLSEKKLVFSDEDGWTPLHWAASIGFLDGVCDLLDMDQSPSPATKKDKEGLLPIHCASMNGYVDVIKVLIEHCKDPNLLNSDGQNVLHVAAKSGQHDVVRYILNTPELQSLIDKGDKHKNMPLHLATVHWQPRIVSALIWDGRVDLNAINEEGLTALDAAEYNLEGLSSFRQWLTWQVLKAAGATRAPSSKFANAERQSSMQSDTAIKTFLLVSILVTVASFGVGYSMLDAYSNSDRDRGTTTILRPVKSLTFVFCTSIAMLSSIVVAATLIWAQLGDGNKVFTALRLAKPLLGMALTMLSLALMARVYLVVSKFHWLADIVLTMGMVSLVSFATLFLPLCFPLPSGYRTLRYITYYPVRLMILLTEDTTVTTTIWKTLTIWKTQVTIWKSKFVRANFLIKNAVHPRYLQVVGAAWTPHESRSHNM